MKNFQLVKIDPNFGELEKMLCKKCLYDQYMRINLVHISVVIYLLTSRRWECF